MVAQTNKRIDDIRQAIAALEAQRELLGDAVVEASVSVLHKELAVLEQEALTGRQQRKQATILFTDIVGHTSLIQDLDPEDNMAIIDEALVRLAEVVTAHGGHIARYQGDGFKAVFGLPVANENDPLNAVRAGLSLITAAHAYAAEIEREWGLTGFNIRVGIDTGLIVAGGATEAEDTIKGLVVNLAARLESAAPPGGVMISHHTYRQLGGRFQVEVLEPIKAKGFPDPVPVYLVERELPPNFNNRIRGIEGIATDMVGRDAELLLLQQSLSAVFNKEQNRLITISGEAGVGKSRLLYEFSERLLDAGDKLLIFKTRATPQTRGSAQYLWRELLADTFQILDSDPVATVRQKLIDGFKTYFNGEAEMKTHLLGAWLGYDFHNSPYLANLEGEAEQLKRHALRYLGQFFLAATGQKPALIIMEDIHWSDRGSLATVVELLRFKPRIPMLLVCLARPSLFTRLPEWDGHLAGQTRIQLSPLTDSLITTLVSSILRRIDPLPDHLLDLIVSRAEGNPFYAEELIKMLIDEGSIITGGDTWHFSPARLKALDVPPTLAGVLQARIDHLEPLEKQALQQASVIGRIFWDRVLEDLPNTCQEALPALQIKEFIFAQANSAFAETIAYIFKHALLREVAYESVLRRLRLDYHRRIGQWLEKHAQGRLDEFAALIADHYSKGGMKVEAAVFWERAGDAAFRSGNFMDARDAFQEALAQDPDLDALALSALFGKLAATLPILDQPKEADEAYRKALSLIDSPSPPGLKKQWDSLKLDLMLGLSDTLYWQDHPQAMSAVNKELEPLLEAVGTLKQKTDYYSRLGQAALLENRYVIPREKWHLVEKSLAYSLESGNQLLYARNCFHMGFHHLWYGEFVQAEQYLDQAWTIADEFADVWLSLQCNTYRAIVMRRQRHERELEKHLPLLLEQAEDVGHAAYYAVGQSCQAWLHYRAGDWQHALAEAQGALATWRDVIYPIQWQANWLTLAIALHQGDLDDGIQSARALIDPKQQRLLWGLEERLQAAVNAWEEQNEALALELLLAARELAIAKRYL